MSRARATALALTNWKGVFYERYLLDPNVTALEGANGAGKTTVMVAAYVVLLPDLSKLRFSNVGESSAAGGERGLRGRLGDPARPSYAAIEYELAGGRRLIAGVHLQQQGGELTLTPFRYDGPSLDGAMKSLLLLQDASFEAVPELHEVKQRALELGGELTVFGSVKDYFGSLFEAGVMPLRLSTDEERRNWNELLRTSMSGGISRSLTTELRSFLLKEETGLTDTLQRMRGTLDACRKTRAEVQEAARLEQEIGGVHEASQAMFDAAYGVVRDRVRAAVRAQAAQQGEQHGREQQLDGCRQQLERLRALEGDAEKHLKAAQDAHVSFAELEVKRARGEALRKELDAAKLSAQAKLQTLQQAQRSLDVALTALDAQQRERERARAEYEDAALGLSDFQEGYADLHRLVHAERRRRALAAELHVLLAQNAPSLDPRVEDEDAVRELRERVEHQLRIDDEVLAGLERRRAGHAMQLDQYQRALQLLRALAPDTSPEQAYERSREVAAEHAADRVAADGLEARRAEVERACLAVEGYAEALARAHEAGHEAGPGLQERVRAELSALRARRSEQELRGLSLVQQEQQLEAELEALEAELLQRQRELPEHTSRWQQLVTLRAAFELPADAPLWQLRERLSDARVALQAQRTEWHAERERLQARLARLEMESGVPEEVAELADQLGGELLASRFDELEEDVAVRVEAELGSLASAIVVADVHAAAERVSRGKSPAEVVLVRPDAALAVGQKSEARDGVVWIAESYGLRIVRAESTGLLGRGRRQELARGVRESLERVQDALVKLEALELQHKVWAELLREVSPIELDPRAPAEQLEHALARRDVSQQTLDALRPDGILHRSTLREIAQREELLEALLAHARTLELPSPQPALERAEAERAAAMAAKQRVTTQAPVLMELSLVAEALREPPLRSEQIEAQYAALCVQRDALFRAAGMLREIQQLGAAASDGELSDWERSLGQGSASRAALEARWQAKQAELRHADASNAQAEQQLAATRTEFGRAEIELAVAQRQEQELTTQLDALGVDVAQLGQSSMFDAAPDVPAAQRALATAMAARVEAEQAERQAQRAWGDEQAKTRALASHVQSARDAWAAFEQQVREHVSLWQPPSEEGDAEPLRDPLAWQAEADSRGRLLVDRLQLARGGEATAARVDAALLQGQHAQAWAVARAWLLERLPAALADFGDPHQALRKLREQLQELSATLTRQEHALRGTSADVARGIDVRVRRAKATVRRMNQHLAQVQFGSVSGIRVDLLRVAKMDGVLEALREGEAQELLFDPSVPLEEAFEEIFKRFAGGGRGADRILDYREYVELSVMVQRRGKGDWESASPARLSTGEAIGVGAALLMVVLTEWEQSSQMFRKVRQGSLRFLFLDEANRLSSDNLGVLFELCQRLELQLLLAAPEVAHATGNTTYRLVRRVDADGHEEVVVSGRRVVANATGGAAGDELAPGAEAADRQGGGFYVRRRAGEDARARPEPSLFGADEVTLTVAPELDPDHIEHALEEESALEAPAAVDGGQAPAAESALEAPAAVDAASEATPHEALPPTEQVVPAAAPPPSSAAALALDGPEPVASDAVASSPAPPAVH